MMKLVIDRSQPLEALGECGDQLHMLADVFAGFSEVMSERTAAGLSSMFNLLTGALDQVQDAVREELGKQAAHQCAAAREGTPDQIPPSVPGAGIRHPHPTCRRGRGAAFPNAA